MSEQLLKAFAALIGAIAVMLSSYPGGAGGADVLEAGNPPLLVEPAVPDRSLPAPPPILQPSPVAPEVVVPISEPELLPSPTPSVAPADPAPADLAPAAPAGLAPAAPADPALADPVAADPALPRRVMPLGDSITGGFDDSGTYRLELERLYRGAGATVDFVGSQQDGPADLADTDHEGHSGWVIDQLAEQVTGWVSAASPDAVLLQIGTNDVLNDVDVANAPARLAVLMDKVIAAAPDATLYVASVPPTSGSEPGIDTLNSAIPDLVAARVAQGSAVVFVDNHAAITTEDLADGVHPNLGGHAKLARSWWQALNS